MEMVIRLFMERLLARPVLATIRVVERGQAMRDARDVARLKARLDWRDGVPGPVPRRR